MQRYLNFFRFLPPLTSNHGTTLSIKKHFIKCLFPESSRKHFFVVVLCRRNILLFHFYCKVGSPENSFLNVACYGCILAPKGMRSRHTHAIKKMFLRKNGKAFLQIFLQNYIILYPEH